MVIQNCKAVCNDKIAVCCLHFKFISVREKKNIKDRSKTSGQITYNIIYFLHIFFLSDRRCEGILLS